MNEIKVGDIVGRKSYGCDVLFKVVEVKDDAGGKTITLKGISYRIVADAPETDLEVQSQKRVEEYRSRNYMPVEKKEREINLPRRRGYLKKVYYRNTPKEETRNFTKPGKVLHIDGDKDYLETLTGHIGLLKSVGCGQ